MNENTTLFEIVETELKRLDGQYIMTPTGIGCGLNEFKSVFGYLNEEAEDIHVRRSSSASYIAVDEELFKVF